MLKRMLVVVIMLVISVTAWAEGEGTGVEVPLPQRIGGVADKTAGKQKPAEPESPLGQRVSADKKKLVAEVAAVRTQYGAAIRRANASNRPADWAEARRLAAQLDTLNAEIQKRISWVEQNPLGGEVGQQKLWGVLREANVASWGDARRIAQEEITMSKAPAKTGNYNVPAQTPARKNRTTVDIITDCLLGGLLAAIITFGCIFAGRRNAPPAPVAPPAPTPAPAPAPAPATPTPTPQPPYTEIESIVTAATVATSDIYVGADGRYRVKTTNK